MKLRLIRKNDALNNAAITEATASSIGVIDLDKKFSSLEKPGLFVLSAPSLLMARSIIVETILNNISNKTALLSFEDRSDVFNISPEKTTTLLAAYREEKLSLNFIYVEEHKDFFNKIKHDIAGKKFAAYDLIIIDIYQDIFLSMPEMDLAFLLSSWQSWFLSQRKICLWLVYGDQASDVINKKFSKFNNLFNGLTVIDYNKSEIRYDIVFWHLKASVQANISLKLQFDDENLQLSVDKYNNPSSQVTLMSPLTGQETTLVLKPINSFDEIFPRKWQVVSNFDEIDKIISHDSVATIIIYITENIEISQIAHNILEIRKKGGRQLKIILREMVQRLRNSDEKLLVNLGANIIIPQAVDFLKFISMVYALQGSYFTRSIPDNIEELEQINLSNYEKGNLTVNDFINQTKGLVDYAQKMEINSSLLKFTLNEAVPIEEILNLINIKRNGDIYTHCNDHLYLFLYQCEMAAINNALNHLFSLPYEDLFLEQEFFTYTDEIRHELKLMANITNTENEIANSESIPKENKKTVNLASVIRNPAQPHNIQ
ncbi:MAG: BcsE family c-di-GMP-binding protein [Methylococcales bacterium]|nr:BcsE family c-di-GMP-binding protein [Methylococcales bacterium]